MPNIREYLRNKKNSSEFGYKSKLVIHKAAVFYRIIVVLVALIAIGIGVYVYFENKVYTEYNILGKAERTDTAATVYRKYGEHILKYSNDGVSCVDTRNNVLWNQTFEMQNPIVDICQDYIAAADKAGNKIYVFDKSGIQGEIDTKLPIERVQIASQGVVYAVLEDGTNSMIYAFDKAGTVLAKSKQPMAKSGYPMDISVSNDGEKLAVSYLYVDSGIMKSDVAFYNFGSIGQNESDNLVSGYTYEETVFPAVQYVNETTAVAFGDNMSVIYKGSQRPEMTAELSFEEEIKSVFHSSQYIAFVFANTEGTERNRIEIYNLDGKKLLSFKFDKDYTDIILNDENFIIQSEKEFSIYNMSGMEKFHYTSKNTLMNVITASGINRYIVIDSAGIEEIGLKLN